MKFCRFIATSFLFMFFSTMCGFAQSKIHMALFCDTNDEKIGESMLTDVEIYKQLMNDVAQALMQQGVQADARIFTGDDCSPSCARDYVRNLSCRGDVVFFVYSGHGGRSHDDDKESNFPRMCFGSNTDLVKVVDIVNTIKSKQPRLIVMVSDCCNSYYDRRISTESMMAGYNAGSGDGLRALFLNQTGVACITAASPGEYGWCTRDGGYLTVNLMDAIYKACNMTSPTWDAIFKEARDKTYNMTVLHGTPKTQTPYFEVNALGIDVDNNNGDSHNNNGDNEDSYNNNGDNGDSINNNGNNTNNVNTNGSSDNTHSNSHKLKRSGFVEAVVHSLPFFILGILLCVKIPEWLSWSGKKGAISRFIGVVLLLKGVLDFFAYI